MVLCFVLLGKENMAKVCVRKSQTNLHRAKALLFAVMLCFARQCSAQQWQIILSLILGRGDSAGDRPKAHIPTRPVFLSGKFFIPGIRVRFAQQRLCVAMLSIVWRGEAWRSKSVVRWPWRARNFYGDMVFGNVVCFRKAKIRGRSSVERVSASQACTLFISNQLIEIIEIMQVGGVIFSTFCSLPVFAQAEPAG